jgi:hypothetical protein
MTPVPQRESATASFLVGLLLLLCALTFYYFAVLNIDYQKTALLDLGPYPDASEYFAQARALLKDGWPSIQIGYDKLPSRFPFGYPVLMLPWLKILPEADSILAPFRTNQTLGFLLLLGVFGFYLYLAMPLTGGFATLLLATLPGFFTFCRSSISEISASALFVLAFMFVYLGLKEERRWKIYLSAVFLGLSLNIRLQSLFLAPLLLAMALFPAKGAHLRWFLHCAALPIVFVLAASPVLALNTVEFHSPFKTGYDYWVPFEKHSLFSPGYIPRNVARFWSEFALRPNRFSAANLFGTGTCFVPAFILLICAGLFFIRINRFVVCAFLAGLSFLAAIVTFRFSDVRYYLPLLILLVAVAVLPVKWATRNFAAGKQTIAALGVFVLFAAACLGYPSRSGYNTVAIDRSQAWDALHFTTRLRYPRRFFAHRRFLEDCGRQPGVILSDIDSVYLNGLLPERIVAVPLDEKHYYNRSKIWHYDRPRAMTLVKHTLAQSIPVYALFLSREEMDQEASRLPALDGYEWIEAGNSATNPQTLRLIPSNR